jgi:hypothetical protein
MFFFAFEFIVSKAFFCGNIHPVNLFAHIPDGSMLKPTFLYSRALIKKRGFSAF